MFGTNVVFGCKFFFKSHFVGFSRFEMYQSKVMIFDGIRFRMKMFLCRIQIAEMTQGFNICEPNLNLFSTNLDSVERSTLIIMIRQVQPY